MIKHIVMFSFLEESNGKTKYDNLKIAKNIMDELPSKIPQIKHWLTGINQSNSPKSFDIVIDSEFEPYDDLETYKVHSAHLELVEFLNTCRDKTHVVDFEF